MENQKKKKKGWFFERRREGGSEGGEGGGGTLQFLHPWTYACLSFWEKEGVLPPKDEDGARRRERGRTKNEGGIEGREEGGGERVSVSTEADGTVVPEEGKGGRLGGEKAKM